MLNEVYIWVKLVGISKRVSRRVWREQESVEKYSEKSSKRVLKYIVLNIHLLPQITCFQSHLSVVNSLKSIIKWAKWADSLGSFFQLIKWAELASSIWRAELSRAEWAGSIWRAELSWAFSEIEFGELSWAEPKSSARLSASYEPSYSSFHL